MPDYAQAKIYKLVDNTNGNTYIGSTCLRLSTRLSIHKSNYKLYLNGRHGYGTSFKIIENGDYDITLLEKCNVTCKDKLHARERYYIETTDCVNKNIPYRTKKEFYEYKNKKIKCDCGLYSTNAHLARHKKTDKHKKLMKSKDNSDESEDD